MCFLQNLETIFLAIFTFVPSTFSHFNTKAVYEGLVHFERISSDSFRPIVLKLNRCFNHRLKI